MITKQELRLLCELSKIGLSDEELEQYGRDMTEIMKLMDTIGDSDFEYDPIDRTREVPFKNLREDRAMEYENMDGLVKNGPKVRANQFAVPKIVD